MVFLDPTYLEGNDLFYFSVEKMPRFVNELNHKKSILVNTAASRNFNVNRPVWNTYLWKLHSIVFELRCIKMISNIYFVKHNCLMLYKFIIIIIYCNWVVTRWQWLFYMYTKYEIGHY